ncbi:MAG: ribonuclease HI [Planctomycetota bacterium]
MPLESPIGFNLTRFTRSSVTKCDHHRGAGSAAPASTYLLVVSAQSRTLKDGHWQFMIEDQDGQPVLHADDVEFGDINRLTLLAAVRGLEAIDGATTVTLLSHNRYLIRSLTDSLPRWRRSDFVWDHFGKRVEVQHADLWRRIDRTLLIHEVQACLVTTRKLIHPHASSDKSTSRSLANPSPVSVEAERSDQPFVRVDDGASAVPAPAWRRRRQHRQAPPTTDAATVPARSR